MTIRSSSPDCSEQTVSRVNVSVEYLPVATSYVVDSSVVPNFNVCNNNYSFEIAFAVNSVTNNLRNAEFNYGGDVLFYYS